MPSSQPQSVHALAYMVGWRAGAAGGLVDRSAIPPGCAEACDRGLVAGIRATELQWGIAKSKYPFANATD